MVQMYVALLVFALVLAALQFGLFGTITGEVIAEELSDNDEASSSGRQILDAEGSVDNDTIVVRKSITSLAVADAEDSGFGRTGIVLVGALIVLGILLWVIKRHRRAAAEVEHVHGGRGRKTIRLDLND